MITDDEAPYFGSRRSDGSLTPGPGARIGATSLESWLAAQAAAA